MTLPGIDIITLLYRCERHLDNYLKALLQVDYPPEKIRINLLDNTGDPQHLEMLRKTLAKYNFPFNVRLEASEKNSGFSGGNNYYFEKLTLDSDFPFFFLLNQDGQIDKNCLNELNNFLIKFPDTGMLEARQTPKEHPKYFDPETYETSWCSGGGVLISKEALKKSGFFDHNFFLYCEDVDLSWRIWLSGFSCRICPKATYYHQTEELDEGKDHSVRYYYSFRNTFYMHFKYDSLWGICQHFFRSIVVCLYQPRAKRKIYLRAFLSAFKKFPFYISNRHKNVKSCKWINFAGFEFGKRREFMDMADGRRVFINK